MEQVVITYINKEEFVDIIEQAVNRIIKTSSRQVIESREKPI